MQGLTIWIYEDGSRKRGTEKVSINTRIKWFHISVILAMRFSIWWCFRVFKNRPRNFYWIGKNSSAWRNLQKEYTIYIISTFMIKLVIFTFRVRFAGSLSGISLMRILIVHHCFVYNEEFYTIRSNIFKSIFMKKLMWTVICTGSLAQK